MVKIALFADTTITRSGITRYCYSLKNMLESRGDFAVSVFADLPHKRCKFFHIYDEEAIKNALLSDDFDIIHINGFISTIPFYVYRELKSLGINKPIVYTPHAHPFYTVNRPLLARAFFHIFVKPKLKKANAVISINKDDCAFFTKYNKNVYTIPHWFDKKYESVPEKDKNKKPLILFVGRNDDNKNLKVLYSLPRDKYRIVCVTNIKPVREDFVFKTQISEDELSELYLRASLTAVPSRYEAFSYVALESLLRGTPVIMSNRVRIADFLDNTSGVTIYDYAKPTDFVNKIEEAIRGHVDINRIREVFSVDKAFSMYSNVYTKTYHSYSKEIHYKVGNMTELHSKLLEMVNDLDAFCKLHNIDYVLCSGNVIGAVRHKGFIPWDDDLDVQMTRENYDKFLSVFKNNEKYYLQKENDDYPLQFSKLRANNTTFIEDIPYKNKYKNIHQGIYIDIFPVDKVSRCNRKAKMQALFSNILVTQSVFLRGYPKSHMNFKKRIAFIIAIILLPLRNYFRKYVKQFNNTDDFEYYCSYYGSRIKRYHEKNTYTPPFERLPYENLELPVMNNYRMYLQKTYGDYMRLPSDAERKYAIHAKCFSLTEDYKCFL